MIKLNNNLYFDNKKNINQQMENISIAEPIDDIIVDLSIPSAPSRIIDNSIVLQAIPLGIPINISSNKMEMDLSIYKHYVIHLHLFTFQTPIFTAKKIQKGIKSIVGISPTMVLLFPLLFYWKW
uniref:Uncharacterized protein n=1 Tax=viral metagenome TaxID=1070528 RepID=A0A6C0HU87_9ZZZZ